MINIKLFQRLSGDLHDCDATIDLLKENQGGSRQAADLLEGEKLIRHALYTEMRGLLTGEDWRELLRLDRGAARCHEY